MAVIETLEVQVTSDTSDARTGLEELIDLTKSLLAVNRALLDQALQGGNAQAAAAKVPVAPMQTLGQKVAAVAKEWRGLIALVGGGLVAKVFSDLRQSAEDLATASRVLGVSTTGLQTLGYAAEQSQVRVEAVTGALESLQDQMTAASLGDQGAMTNLGFLGLSRDALQGMDAPERFSAVAEALLRIEDPARRVGVATRVFGSAARELQPLLEKTPDQLRAMGQEFMALGGGLSGDAVAAFAEWDRGISKVKVSLLSFRGLLAQTLLPVLNAVGSAFGKVVMWLNSAQKSFKLLEVVGIGAAIIAFVKLGRIVLPLLSAMNTQTVLLMAKWLAWAAVIAAVAIVIQDLIHLFRGGRSAVAEWIDSFTELGKVDGWVRNIKAGLTAIADLQFPGIEDISEAFRNIFRGDELRGQIEGLEEALTKLRAQRDKASGPERSALSQVISNNEARLTAYRDEYFGVRGLRAVGRGVTADVQRSGELTTGSMSRNEGGISSVTIHNQIQQEINAQGGAARAVGDATQRGLESANRKMVRDIKAAAGSRR